MPVDYEIVHRVPGRIRLRVPALETTESVAGLISKGAPASILFAPTKRVALSSPLADHGGASPLDTVCGSRDPDHGGKLL
jgi:hypothetical protein